MERNVDVSRNDDDEDEDDVVGSEAFFLYGFDCAGPFRTAPLRRPPPLPPLSRHDILWSSSPSNRSRTLRETVVTTNDLTLFTHPGKNVVVLVPLCTKERKEYEVLTPGTCNMTYILRHTLIVGSEWVVESGEWRVEN